MAKKQDKLETGRQAAALIQSSSDEEIPGVAAEGANADDGALPAEDDASLALQRQIDELKKSEAAHKAAAEQASRDREAALRRANERELEIQRFQQENQEFQYDAIGSALAAAKAEADMAQADIEAAIADGDSKAQADAYRRLAKAESNISRLEDGKSELEAAKKAAEKTTPARQQPNAVEATIDNSGLPETAKAWLTLHPEYLRDPRKNSKIQALHWDVLDEGHQAFSPEYFKSLEEHLGMREKPLSQEDRDNQPQNRSSIMSAPVSREVPGSGGQRQQPGQVRLTAAQREAAKMAGVSEKTYAENLQKLNDMKANGTYGDRQ